LLLFVPSEMSSRPKRTIAPVVTYAEIQADQEARTKMKNKEGRTRKPSKKARANAREGSDDEVDKRDSADSGSDEKKKRKRSEPNKKKESSEVPKRKKKDAKEGARAEEEEEDDVDVENGDEGMEVEGPAAKQEQDRLVNKLGELTKQLGDVSVYEGSETLIKPIELHYNEVKDSLNGPKCMLFPSRLYQLADLSSRKALILKARAPVLWDLKDDPIEALPNLEDLICESDVLRRVVNAEGEEKGESEDGASFYIPKNRLPSLGVIDELLPEIVEKVRTSLFPHEPTLRAELLQLTINLHGGRPLQLEMPPNPEIAGALIVGLPTAFSGGQLYFDDPSDSMTDLSALFAPIKPPVPKEVPEYDKDAFIKLRDPELLRQFFYDVVAPSYISTHSPCLGTKRPSAIASGQPRHDVLPYVAFATGTRCTLNDVHAGARMVLTFQLIRQVPLSPPLQMPMQMPMQMPLQMPLVDHDHRDKDGAAAPPAPADSLAAAVGMGVGVGVGVNGSVAPGDLSAAPGDGMSAGENGEGKLMIRPEDAERFAHYMKLSLTALKDLCREAGLKMTGTKEDIVSRLLHPDSQRYLAQAEDKRPPPPLPPAVLHAKSLQYARALQHALSDARFFHKGGELAFQCSHLYDSESEVAASEKKLGRYAKACELQLRGVDSLLAVIACRLGLEVHLVRMAGLCDEVSVCVGGGGGEGGREEGGREGGREKDRQTYRYTGIQTVRQTCRQADRERQKETEKDRETDRQTDRQAGRQTQTYIQTGRQAETDRERERER
jgi:hypothetical protein